MQLTHTLVNHLTLNGRILFDGKNKLSAEITSDSLFYFTFNMGLI